MIREYKNVLTTNECELLINISKEKLKSATTLGKNIEGYRTADTMWLREKSDLSDKIKKLVVEKTNLPLENQEAIHIVKYEIGGQYKLHHDFFHPNTDYYESCIKQGGQRAYSCLIYLNDNFTGGETDFPKVNKTVIPELGKLIVWDNLKEDGSLDYDSFHAGLPVIEGQKWICIVWVRENKFI